VTAVLEAVAPRTPTGRASGRGPSPVLLVPAALVLLAGALRLWGLDVPERLYFDEKYYARDAMERLQRGIEEGRSVHPPLGTWLIAAGIEVFGSRPIGWRIPSALAGTLTILVTYLLGRRLTGSVPLAGLAGLLVAVDGLALTASRIAILDVFLGLFVLTALWLVVRDRDARRLGPSGPLAAAVGSRWRWAAGLALGLAVSTKWSGLLAVAFCGLAVVAAEVSRPAASPTGRLRSAAAAAAGGAVALLVLPAAVYLASWAGWFAEYEKSYAGVRACGSAQPCQHGALQRLDTWWGFQHELVRYHRDLDATHPYRSSPAGWLVLARPVLQYRETCADGGAGRDTPCVVEPGQKAVIVGLGNPVLWWGALLAYPLLAWRALRRRDAGAATVLGALLLLWLPWFAAGKPGYLFYLVPAVPLIALAPAVALAAVHDRRRRQVVAAVLAVSVAVAFLWFYPVLTGVPLPEAEVGRRLWLGSWL
jgi:dolichyl-phosphate-mannose-protein mannosyltransferase